MDRQIECVGDRVLVQHSLTRSRVTASPNSVLRLLEFSAAISTIQRFDRSSDLKCSQSR